MNRVLRENSNPTKNRSEEDSYSLDLISAGLLNPLHAGFALWPSHQSPWRDHRSQQSDFGRKTLQHLAHHPQRWCTETVHIAVFIVSTFNSTTAATTTVGTKQNNHR